MNLKSIIIITVGIITGITLTKLFSSTNRPNSQPTTANPTALQKQTAKTEIHFQQKIDSLNTNNQALNSKLSNSKAALTMAKNKTLVLQTQLQTLLSSKSTDTAKADNHFAVAEIKLTALIKENNSKDSIYDNIDSTRLQQLENKETVITVKDSLYQSLKQSYNRSLTQQAFLYDQNKQFQKQFNRQKLKSKWLSAGILILSATAANYLIRN